MTKEIKPITDDINIIQQQLDDEQGEIQKFWPVIIVKVYADKAVMLPITRSYFTYRGGWSPNYDIRVPNIDNPAHLTYKASIYQDIGLDWQNIDLTLSTANPSENPQIKPLTRWIISIENNHQNSDNNLFYSFKLLPKATMSRMAINDDAYLALTDYVTPNVQGINQQYHIQLPFTIKNHSQDNIVTLKETELATSY